MELRDLIHNFHGNKCYPDTLLGSMILNPLAALGPAGALGENNPCSMLRYNASYNGVGEMNGL
jgi:hypothetical protein